MKLKKGSLATAFLLLAVFFITDISSSEDFRERTSSKRYDIADADDVKAEIHFGREVAARILGRYGLYENEDLNRYVSLVGKAVAQQAGRSEIDFHFAVLKTDSINAYAAPGGYVFVTRGAILNMQDEAELAAVLAHEIAHISRKHIVKELDIHASDDSPVGSFARFMGGAGDPAKAVFLSTVDKANEILFERGYKIEDEKDADITGTIFLALSGYDSTALARYLGRIQTVKSENVKVLSKTHPDYDERIKLISGIIQSEGLDTGENKQGKERFSDYKKRI
jgi:predicted Zn-dependent protease